MVKGLLLPLEVRVSGVLLYFTGFRVKKSVSILGIEEGGGGQGGQNFPLPVPSTAGSCLFVLFLSFFFSLFLFFPVPATLGFPLPTLPSAASLDFLPLVYF